MTKLHPERLVFRPMSCTCRFFREMSVEFVACGPRLIEVGQRTPLLLGLIVGISSVYIYSWWDCNLTYNWGVHHLVPGYTDKDASWRILTCFFVHAYPCILCKCMGGASYPMVSSLGGFERLGTPSHCNENPQMSIHLRCRDANHRIKYLKIKA